MAESQRPTTHCLVVCADEAGQRLDRLLQSQISGLSRSRAQKLIAANLVHVGKQAAKASKLLRPGEVIHVTLPAPEPLVAEAENIPLSVLYEDPYLIVVDKPAGMVAHPAAGHPRGTLVNALLFHCRDLSGIGGVLRPGIVHRLDKDTSGVLVASKDDSTHQALAALFKNKTLRREYLAVVSPSPRARSGTIETLYARHPVHRKKFSSRVKKGKKAVTHWHIVEEFGPVAILCCRLDTGRTHQIRVHLADRGWPLLSDPLYGRRYRGELAHLTKALPRQALHARTLEFVHPRTGKELAFHSPIPADMQALIESLSSWARLTS